MFSGLFLTSLATINHPFLSASPSSPWLNPGTEEGLLRSKHMNGRVVKENILTPHGTMAISWSAARDRQTRPAGESAGYATGERQVIYTPTSSVGGG